jgi:hypothetical protein
VVGSEQEAALIRGLLESAGIDSDQRAAQGGENFGGTWEVVVREEDLETARELLPQEE